MASDQNSQFQSQNKTELGLQRNLLEKVAALRDPLLLSIFKQVQLLGFDPYEAYKIRRLFRKKDIDNLPDLYRIFHEDEDSYRTMYQKHNENLVELMKKDREIDMEELDKAWTFGSPEA